jgi:citrate lyase subunit alpha/citrate CoA-transferase
MSLEENALGRPVPRSLPDLGKLEPYGGAFLRVGHPVSGQGGTVGIRSAEPRKDKVAPSLKEAIRRSGLENGMTISFHHHLRNGDAVMPLVLGVLKEMGYRNLTLAPSSIPDSHDCVADFIRCGLIRCLHTSGVRGELGRMISRGEMEAPVIIRSHGGRARAVEEGSLKIDVAFLAAPTADRRGNFCGCVGPSACGSLGYAITDARFARHVVALTDHLIDEPLTPRISVPQYLVDQIARVDSLGDPRRIATDAVRITKNPLDLAIARDAFALMRASGLLVDGCSFQVGAGGASLAVAAFLRDYFRETRVRGGFGLGGISGYMSQMLEEGHFRVLYDVQSFDSAVTGSMMKSPNHLEIDPSWYANPFNAGCLVNDLDVVILGALEVDCDFNVNVVTGHDGVLRGASGGHSDTAAGAKLSVVVAPSFRGGVPTIKDRVQTVVTPGETVDAIVTERGICINPRREDLIGAARRHKLPLADIRALKAEVEELTGRPEPVVPDESRVVAVVEYRDGTLIDSVFRVR